MKLYTHNCFGDHCVCFGIVKELSKQYDEIFLTTRNNPRQFQNVQRLYSGIENVIITTESFKTYDIVVSSQWWFNQVSHWYQYPTPTTPFPYGEDMIFDRFWYRMVGMPFNLKWDNFYFERDLNKEKEVYYDKLGLKDKEEYIFIHEDMYNKDENRTIKRKYLDPNVKLINMTDYDDIDILDTSYLIENSKEVHVINSSFRTFIDLMNIKHNSLNYHKYCRSNPAEQVAVRLIWKTYDD